MLVLGTVFASCEKETTESINQVQYKVDADSIIFTNTLYTTKSKDVGGYYTTTIELTSPTEFRFTLDRGAGYYADFTGTWELNTDTLRMMSNGSVIVLGSIVKTQTGFALLRTNGKIEVYYN